MLQDGGNAAAVLRCCVAESLALMRRIDALLLDYPFYGSRQMARHLQRDGVSVRRRVCRLMRLGLEAIYRRPRTSDAQPGHRIYPSLLRGLTTNRPDPGWCADVTYIPLSVGFLYLVAIMDWASRHVLAWRLSNTMDTGFCVEALEAALQTGTPGIFNTDQGAQFTSAAFTDRVHATGAQRAGADRTRQWSSSSTPSSASADGEQVGQLASSSATSG